jgi:CRP/FNR family transcriptional regulator
MPRENPVIAIQTPDDGCTPVSCRDCGVYRLCHAGDGETDVKLPERRKRTLKRGEPLFRAGEPFRNVYAIRYGSVKTAVVTNDGRVQVTGFHIGGELLGLSAIATDRYNCEASALEATGVCEVSFDRFRDLSHQIPTLQYEMLHILSREILHNQDLVLLLGKKNARERLATYLLNLSQRLKKRNRSHTRFNLTMSRSDIGNYLGLAEETVCRIFSLFHEEGLVTTHNRQIQLNDLDRLKAIARA